MVLALSRPTSLEFVPLDMLNRSDERNRFDVYRHCGGADIPDQRLRVQPEELERWPVLAADRCGGDRPPDLYGQAVGEFVALILNVCAKKARINVSACGGRLLVRLRPWC